MPISIGMGSRSIIGMCASFGMIVGGFVPAIWGASQLGMQSFLFGIVGAAAGFWAGMRISED